MNNQDNKQFDKMQKISIIVVVWISVLAIHLSSSLVQAADEEEFEEEPFDALSFLVGKRVYKQFKTKCEEQKREAKAAYESRCEPSIHLKLSNKNAADKPRSTSNEFLRQKRGIFHPGLTACEEQKREAREDYEERCEPSIPWQRNRNSNRFCPDINDWHELDTYEIGDGGGFDLDTLSKLVPQNMSMEKIIGGVIGGIISAGVGGKRSAAHANHFLKRTFFHPGRTNCEEQKREAREDYEERCEPSFPLYRNTGTNRYCPDINSWTELDNYEIGDGYEARVPINDDRKNRNQYNAYSVNYPRSTTSASTTTNEDLDVDNNS
ncbi:unnamed protein product [Rotaria magnacalcarata]|uniref:Uncharacterized protein n=1 Tax=Rotaria magnacalcarata TaxID=392030 RepID=A0A816VVT8_9BILA|nr:unnamed protein product [Rotaria magnacalcarata]